MRLAGGLQMRAHLLTTTAVMALLSASIVSTRAQTTNWTGLASSDWFVAGNWTAGVPTAATGATIETTRNPTVVSAPNAEAQSIVLGQVGVGNLTI